MFRIERDVTNQDESRSSLRVIFDTDGVEITADDYVGAPRILNLTHEEAEGIFDLLGLAHPAYKAGTRTKS